MMTHARLVEHGCLCGSDRPQDCTLHGPGDNRGIAAYFKAGMPNSFPITAYCSLCHTRGLLYPNVEIDDPKGSGEYKPTLVCPHCSHPAAERSLRADAEAFGHELNGRSIFGLGPAVQTRAA